MKREGGNGKIITNVYEEIQSYNKKIESLEYETSKLKDKQVEFLRAHEKIDGNIAEAEKDLLEYNNRMAESLAYEESSQRILQITQAEKASLMKEL